MSQNPSNMHELQRIIRAYLATDELPEGCENLHTRSGRRGMLLRLRLGDARPVIVKLWLLRNLKELAKRYLGLSNGSHEWHMHRDVHRVGILVPKPIGYRVLRIRSGERYEMMAVQDLGTTTKGLRYLKRLVRAGDEAGVQAFEEKVIDMTQRLIAARMVDVDHQLNNFVIDGSQAVYRIDFECARHWKRGHVPEDELGTMIGRLVCSHAYACQPDLGRTEAFASRLVSRVGVSANVLKRTEQVVTRNLERQRQRSGVDSRLSLAWAS